MPRIAEYTNKEQLDASPLSGAAAEARRAGQIGGGAISKLGGEISGLFNMVEEHDTENEKSKVANEAADAELQLSQQYAKDKANFDPNDPDSANKWLNGTLTPTLDKLGDGLQTKGGQEYAQQIKNRLKVGFGMRAIADQSNMTANVRLSNADDSNNKLQMAAQLDPSMTQHYLDIAPDIVGAGLDPETKATALVKVRSGIANAGAESLVSHLENNPNATVQDAKTAMDLLNSPDHPFLNNMSPEKHEELVNRLGKFKDAAGGIQFGLIKQQLPLMQQQLDAGGDPSQMKQAVDTMTALAKTKDEKLEANMAARDLDYHITYGKTIQATNDLPDAEIDAKVAGLREHMASATSDEDRLQTSATIKAMLKAQDTRNAAYKADPAGYSIQNDKTTAARAAAFAQTPNPTTFAQYAAAQDTYQNKFRGAAPAKYVTKEMSNNIAQAVQAVRTDPKGAEALGQTLAQWSNITGPKWVQVARELHTSNVLNDDQFVAASVYQKPDARVLAQTLLQSSAMSSDDRFKLHGVSEMKVQQSAIDALQPLAQSLGNTGPDGADMMRANVNSIVHLMQVQGPDADPKALADALINNEYNFRGRNGFTTLRIPNKPGIDADAVQSGTDRQLREVGSLNLAVPKSLSGLGDADQRKNYVDRLQHDGVWYANSSGTGATLYDISGGGPVKETVNGKTVPVTRRWEQLSERTKEDAASQSAADASIATYERMGSH